MKKRTTYLAQHFHRRYQGVYELYKALCSIVYSKDTAVACHLTHCDYILVTRRSNCMQPVAKKRYTVMFLFLLTCTQTKKKSSLQLLLTVHLGVIIDSKNL